MKAVIEKLDHFGNGLARLDGKIVFVPLTLPGDVVEIEIVKDNKKFLEGKVINYIEKQPRHSICPYSNTCGGCHLIDLKYDEQLKYKENKVKELFKKVLNIDVDIKDIMNGNNYYYRNKISLHVKNKRIGFYSEESHNLVEIDKCVITDKEINEVIKRLKSIVLDNDIEEVMIRNHNGILLSIKGKVKEEVLLNSFDNCEVIYLNDKLIKGAGFVISNVLDKKLKVSRKSFFQVNNEVCTKIFEKVRNYVKDKNYSKVLDLYCGTGIIGILISDLVENVTGIEVVRDAVRNANDNKKLNGINNINFICDKVENRINEFNDIDLIIVDPPRSGLDKKSIDNILRIGAKEIIYISCNPNTLVRDLKELTTSYDIKEVSIADMFPNTYHVETIVFLSNKS